MVGLMNPSGSGSGFNFGQQNQNTTTPSSLGSFSFGSGLSFGAANQTGTTATVNPLSSSGFALGPSASGGINFGQQSQPSSGFSLGQQSLNTTSAASGLNFGSAGTSTTSSSFSFGQQPQQTLSSNTTIQNNPPSSSLGGFSFGQTNAPTSAGLNFGLGSGTTTTTTAGGLGQTASTGFSFGQSVSSTSANNTSGSFNNPQTTNTTATSTATGLFAQTSSTNPVSSSTGLFGQGSISSTQGGLFTQTPSTTTSGINFGLGSGGLFSQSSNTPASTGINFNTPASSAAGFSLSTGTTSSGFSLTGGAGGAGGLGGTTVSSSIFSAPASTSTLGLGGSLPASSLSTSGGLGGFQTSTVDSGSGTDSTKDGKSIKETPLPQDIFAAIAVFESHKDSEKKCSEDNIRQTATPFLKLVEDTRKLRQHIVKLSNQNSQLQSSAQKLKSSVIQEAENVEMARRTQDTPMNLQGDNKSPEQFFLRLVRSFEERMTFCRNRIEEVEKCARSNGTFSEITSDDMKEVLKKEHEIVKMLAAKIYTLHNQLISYTNQSNPEMQPDVLFKPVLTELQPPIGILSKNTSTLRPALGEGGSGLLNFQNGQQRAKAVSLGAAPPTVPLGQVSSSNLLGSTSQSNIFSGSPNATFGSSLFNISNNANNNSFGFGNKPVFNSNSSFFGNQSVNPNQSTGMFSPGSNAPLFGNVKSIKK